MIRNLLATTALATLLATGGAHAQMSPAPAPDAGMAPMAPAEPVQRAEGHLASNIIGETVYNGSGDDASNIGSVNDIIISTDGQLQAIVVGVGGFLGLGQKNVAIDYAAAEWVERDGDRWLVVPTTAEELQEKPDFDFALYDPIPSGEGAPTVNTTEAPIVPAEELSGTTAAPADQDLAADEGVIVEDDTTAEAPAMTEDETTDMADEDPVVSEDETTDMAAEDPAVADPSDEELTADVPPAGQVAPDVAAEDGMAETDTTAEAPIATDDTPTAAIDRSTLTEATGLSADELIGTTVYGADEENVGSIGDVILSDAGDVEAVIVDVGGFLGMGTKPVAVSFDDLAFMSDADGNNYLYTSFTQEQLEAAPEYDATTYAEQRDDQLIFQN